MLAQARDSQVNVGMKQTLNGGVKNLLRSRQPFFSLRHRLVSSILLAPDQTLEIASPFLIASLFPLDRAGDWKALAFSRTDFKTLDKLAGAKPGNVERNLLYLTGAYIASNIERVRELETVSQAASALVLQGKADEVDAKIKSLEAKDKQSLFVFRLVGAINAHTHSVVARHFGEERHSAWVRQRFVYPLIFHSINHPDAGALGETLRGVFPWLDSEKSEGRAVQYLLRHDYDHGDSLSFRCFIALMSHPFDALEMLTGHFENSISANRALREYERELLEALAELFPGSRIAFLAGIAARTAIEVSGSDEPIRFDFPIHPEGQRFFQAFFDLRHTQRETVGTKLLDALGRMRWSKYPARADFEAVVGVSGQYMFLAVGRLLDTALTSIFMVARRPAKEEVKGLIRAMQLLGGGRPFILTSPRGASLLEGSIVTWAAPVQSLERLVQSELPIAASDRVWIKAFHWNVREKVRKLQLAAYFREVRAAMRSYPNSRYLSGIDWDWLQEVIARLRIAPFRSVDGVYILLLRAVEERTRQPNDIKTALKPVTDASGSVSEFVKYLIGEYGRDAVSFIRQILTPEMILKMQLETYYAAALAERLNALSEVSKQFGFDAEMMTESQFLLEQQTLSTALTLMNVNAAQFAVSWDTIRSNAISLATDTYEAFAAVNTTFNKLPLIGDFYRSSSITFANRRTVGYSLQNKSWPVAAIIGQVIDAFLSHPSHGIESILAVRIRHDNLRYEFGIAIDAVRVSRISGVSEVERAEYTPTFEKSVNDVINDWVDKYMHTSPAAGRAPLFDFTPTEKEMRSFVGDLPEDASLDDIVEFVVGWLQSRLTKQLQIARDLLSGELKSSIDRCLAETGRQIVLNGGTVTRVEKVERALRAGLDRRADELLEWFETPSEPQLTTLGFAEIKLAVDGRYRREREAGKLKINLTSVGDCTAPIAPDSVRLVFDIWCELAKNALKYSGKEPAALRIWPRTLGAQSGFVFSSLSAEPLDFSDLEFRGMPSVSTSAAIFTTGKSGLPKVAHLAAAVAQAPVSVLVSKRAGAFHVFVPFLVRKGVE